MTYGLKPLSGEVSLTPALRLGVTKQNYLYLGTLFPLVGL